MTTLREAAQQALEALDGLSEEAVCQSSHHAKKDQHTSLDVCPVFLRLRVATTALRAALAEDAMQKFSDVNQELEAALAEPTVPSDYCADSHQPVTCDRCGKVTKQDDIHTCTPRRLTDAEIGEVWFAAKIPGLTETQARLLIRAAERRLAGEA